MKTVQYYLQTVDRKRLLHDLSYDYISDPLHLLEMPERSIQEIRDAYENAINELIEQLLEMTVQPSSTRVLLLYDIINSGGREYGLELCDFGELEKDINAPGYAFEFTNRVDALGFLVADNRLTQDNIYYLLAEFIKEITFFGISEQDHSKHINDVIKRLDKANEEIKQGKTIPAEKMFAEFREKYGLPEPEKDSRQDELKIKVFEAENAFIQYSRTRERKRVLRNYKAAKEEYVKKTT